MQFLNILSDSTLSQIADVVGKDNVDEVLALNQLTRARNIGKNFADLCSNIVHEAVHNVTPSQKSSILNTFTAEQDVFEHAAMLSEESWKVLNSLNTFPGFLRLPDSIAVPDSVNILGGKLQGISQQVYKAVMDCLVEGRTIDSSIFNEYSSSTYTSVSGRPTHAISPTNAFSAFNLPWGKIQLYSSLADATIDFPVYPEEISESRSANYTEMPDLIYQYEPWYMYSSSGPRSQSYTFHFHRDMWSGNHLDNKAIELVRFCEANTFARYSGSAVNAAIVRMYINGRCHIAGRLTQCEPKWSGPIGLDGWYLDCELTLNITEVSDIPLNYDSVRNMGIIGT